MGVAIGIVGGALITIATAILVEYLRTPRLRLTIESPTLDLSDRRNLRVWLHNDAPFFARLIQRSAALQCQGEITFHDPNDGHDIFNRAMVVRWVNSPEPIASQILDLNGQVKYVVNDFARAAAESRMDIYPGDGRLLDVAVRYKSEERCYGWNNDSYFYKWRNPNWALGRGRYLVKVVISSSGQKCTDVFCLLNEVESLDAFRLTAASDSEREKVLRSS
jgi:hypothetical protein